VNEIAVCGLTFGLPGNGLLAGAVVPDSVVFFSDAASATPLQHKNAANVRAKGFVYRISFPPFLLLNSVEHFYFSSINVNRSQERVNRYVQACVGWRKTELINCTSNSSVGDEGRKKEGDGSLKLFAERASIKAVPGPLSHKKRGTV
jgi:hypothetical protein